MDQKHEIFRTPRPVALAFEDAETPKHYRALDPSLGETIAVVRFHEEKRRDGAKKDPGLVTSGDGLLDSPEVEVFGTGINSKGPSYAGLARQGNFLLWGFNASPADLTPAARDLFENAARYVARFREDRPLVSRKSSTRRSLDRSLSFLEKREGKEFLATAGRLFGAEVVESFGADLERYRRWVEENRPHLRSGAGEGAASFVVDEDCKRLGVANDEIACLEKAVGLLADEATRGTGHAILRRYTGLDLPAAAEPWRAWLEESRPYLFFSDGGGFRWFVDALAKARGVPTAELRGPARADRQTAAKAASGEKVGHR